MAIEDRRSFIGTLLEVSVLDDYVVASLRQELVSFARNIDMEIFGWKSNATNDRFSFWHTHFAGGDLNSRISCEQELYARNGVAPITKLWEFLKHGPLEGHLPLRIYANAHTYGSEGYLHTDNEDPDNYFTTIYYAHLKWNSQLGGRNNILLFDQSAKLLGPPSIQNRGDLSLFAAPFLIARSPSRDCPYPRLTLVFCMQVVPK